MFWQGSSHDSRWWWCVAVSPDIYYILQIRSPYIYIFTDYVNCMDFTRIYIYVYIIYIYIFQRPNVKVVYIVCVYIYICIYMYIYIYRYIKYFHTRNVTWHHCSLRFPTCVWHQVIYLDCTLDDLEKLVVKNNLVIGSTMYIYIHI